MEIPLLFENDHCLVFNKPAGLSVQGGEGVKVSLDSIISGIYSPRPLLVHRLDRDTSGVILVARNREAAAEFSALFADSERDHFSGRKKIGKKYLAAVSGIPESESGEIRLDLSVHGKNKKSDTLYRLISGSDKDEKADGDFSLLELEPGTGRMHQIRRHLASLGHPVLGDDKYGDFKLNKKLRKLYRLKNLLLHASRLRIPPIQGFMDDGIDVSADLPDYFVRFLSEIKVKNLH